MSSSRWELIWESRNIPQWFMASYGRLYITYYIYTRLYVAKFCGEYCLHVRLLN